MSIHLCCIDIIFYLSRDVVMLFTSYTASTIVQIFPENVDYSCHSPSIKLKCTFTENPLTAFWTLFAGGRVPMQVTVSTPGHTVDPSEIQNGAIFLKIEDTMYSENNSYSCVAVYADGNTETSDIYLIPLAESK